MVNLAPEKIILMSRNIPIHTTSEPIPSSVIYSFLKTSSFYLGLELIDKPTQPLHKMNPKQPESYKITNNPHKSNKGIYRAFKAGINSCQGIIYAIKEESAFRQELGLAIILIPLACYLNINYLEKLLLINSVLLVLALELINSGIEAAIDRVSYEFHDLSKRAKDFGSAAVMIAIIICCITWWFILQNHLSI
jgi:diacylglycerol kinase (ATP)